MIGAVCQTNPAQPPQSLKSVCYPHLFKVNTEAVHHECKHEAVAIKTYEDEMKNSHVNFKLSQCGLVITQDISWYFAHAVDWDVEKSNVPYVLTDVTLTVMV